MKNKEVLIITGCVKPDNNAIFLSLKNEKKRLEQYLETIKWALLETNFDIVIFCENSHCKYDFDKYVSSFKNSKIFEYLTFNGNHQKSNALGKGYGEGEILKYAYDNSKYLKKCDDFYKITGRLKIININEILGKSKNKTYFLNNLEIKNTVDTRFYKMETKIYKTYFYNSYTQVDDKMHMILEKVYYNVFKENKLKYYCFKNYPLVRGISGSTGIIYRVGGLKAKVYNFLCVIKIYNLKIISILFRGLILMQKIKNKLFN